MKIITNWNKRPFVYRYDVPDDVLENQFDYLDEDTVDGFLKYKDNWYHLSDFMKHDDDYWQGYISDSYFSGVLIHVSEDGEEYVIGWYLS